MAAPKRRVMKRKCEDIGGKIVIPPDPQPPSPLTEEIKDRFLLKVQGTDGVSHAAVVHGRSLEFMKEIGRGRYGSVDLMREPATGFLMAVKRIKESSEVQDFRYIQREVRANQEGGACPFLVRCFGVMRLEGDVWICMEVMDASLDRFYKFCSDLTKPIPEPLMGRIAHSVICGLLFLAKELHLMHRDVKPTNMLINRQGQIKLCDYGVSGVLESTGPAKTINAGCKPYMGPERIDNNHEYYDKYDERSDVWSLGISLYEMATGIHPYSKWKSPWQQMSDVVYGPAPQLETTIYSSDFVHFVNICLTKEFEDRPSYTALLAHPFITNHLRSEEDSSGISEFTASILDQIAALSLGQFRSNQVQ